MKKVFWALSLISMLALTSCGGKTDPTKDVYSVDITTSFSSVNGMATDFSKVDVTLTYNIGSKTETVKVSDVENHYSAEVPSIPCDILVKPTYTLKEGFTAPGDLSISFKCTVSCQINGKTIKTGGESTASKHNCKSIEEAKEWLADNKFKCTASFPAKN